MEKKDVAEIVLIIVISLLLTISAHFLQAIRPLQKKDYYIWMGQKIHANLIIDLCLYAGIGLLFYVIAKTIYEVE